MSLGFLGGCLLHSKESNPLYDILVSKYGSGPSFSVSLLGFLSTSSQTFPQKVLQFDVTFMSLRLNTMS